jgi:hypothetical protein
VARDRPGVRADRPTSQAIVRTWLEPRWPVAVGLAIVLGYLIVELGGEGGAEFVYFQF